MSFRRRFPSLWFYGPWIGAGIGAALVLPIVWVINPRTQNRDGSHARSFHHNGFEIGLLALLAVVGLGLAVVIARAWWITAHSPSGRGLE